MPDLFLPVPDCPRPHLGRAFYTRETTTVAQALLGQLLVRTLDDGTRLSGLIVETEAYLGPDDRAAHTFGGRHTPRNDAMWRIGGTCYVYFTYGLHHCMNIVTRDAQTPQAALIRALQPVEGIEHMHRHRFPDAGKPRRETDLCSGPAKLCQALAIDRALNGTDLCGGGPLHIEQTRARRLPSQRIAVGPRVGIGYAGDWVDRPLRFSVADNPHVSR
jgi:DNA-3-methyladenine glycosylase